MQPIRDRSLGSTTRSGERTAPRPTTSSLSAAKRVEHENEQRVVDILPERNTQTRLRCEEDRGMTQEKHYIGAAFTLLSFAESTNATNEMGSQHNRRAGLACFIMASGGSAGLIQSSWPSSSAPLTATRRLFTTGPSTYRRRSKVCEMCRAIRGKCGRTWSTDLRSSPSTLCRSATVANQQHQKCANRTGLGSRQPKQGEMNRNKNRR